MWVSGLWSHCVDQQAPMVAVAVGVTVEYVLPHVYPLVRFRVGVGRVYEQSVGYVVGMQACNLVAVLGVRS